MNITIINSRDWGNGWMVSPDSQKSVIAVLKLKNAGFGVLAIEVELLEELLIALKDIPTDTLVWVNTYWLKDAKGNRHNVSEIVEALDLSFVGSYSETLQRLLHKDKCQQLLVAQDIPVPRHLIVDRNMAEHLEIEIKKSNFEFPVVVKPTNQSRSQGISIANNSNEAIAYAERNFNKFPNDNLIIEEFIAGKDVTCGFIQLGEQTMLLPSFIVINGLDCSNDILGEVHYKLPPDAIQQVMIKDEKLLEQIKREVPKIITALGIKGLGRIDGRIDQDGTIRFFDVNGMPGLNYPSSGIIQQCIQTYKTYAPIYVFECLIHTIVADSLMRFDRNVPTYLQENNLFQLTV